MFFSDTHEKFIEAWPTGLRAHLARARGLTLPRSLTYHGDGNYHDADIPTLTIPLEHGGRTHAIARWIVPVEPPKRYKLDRLRWTGSYGWSILLPRSSTSVGVGDARDEAVARRARVKASA